jgi:hypothetical protein
VIAEQCLATNLSTVNPRIMSDLRLRDRFEIGSNILALNIVMTRYSLKLNRL